jgi:DNA modification methylase
LQYKTVPVTENVLVYRKSSTLLIDWFIRNHPDRDIVTRSKIADDYERTNVWRIQPNTNSKHPAAFPVELAERVIKYYSFIGDVVMDPLAGSGTVGAAAAKLGRRFVLYDNNEDYIDMIRASVGSWLGKEANNVLWKNCMPAPQVLALFESPGEYGDATSEEN